MSLNALLYSNLTDLYAGTLNLKGKTASGVKVAPITTDSDVLVANLYATRALTADGTFGNVIAGTSLDVSSFIHGDSLTVAGNVVCANVIASGNVDAVNVNATNVNATGDIKADGNVEAFVFISTAVSQPPLVVASTELVQNLYVARAAVADNAFTANIIADSISVSGNIDVSNVNVTGIVNAPTVAVSGDVSAVNGVFSGNVDANNVNATASVTGVSGIFSGNVDAVNVNASGVVNAGSVVASGNVQGSVLISTVSGQPPFVVTSSVEVANLKSESAASADAALGLQSATTVVSINSSAAPTSGQVLIASSGTAAAWGAIPAGSETFTYTSTATAAGTTALDISATYYNIWTGATTQTVKLPSTDTVPGSTYVFKNLSSGDVTLQAADASALIVLSTNDVVKYCCITADAPTNAAWTQVI